MWNNLQLLQDSFKNEILYFFTEVLKATVVSVNTFLCLQMWSDISAKNNGYPIWITKILQVDYFISFKRDYLPTPQQNVVKWVLSSLCVWNFNNMFLKATIFNSFQANLKYWTNYILHCNYLVLPSILPCYYNSKAFTVIL